MTIHIDECDTQQKLRAFIELPGSGDPDPGTFAKIVTKAIELGIGTVQLADSNQMSQKTIERWATGRVTPHRIMSRTFVDQLKKMLPA